MLGRTNAGGGGGAGLNFKVVGGTVQPNNPSENMIWINTDAEITSWTFSATQPETAAEGMVWISTGTSSPTEFNALKKNDITVYPTSAKQYLDGAWVDKTMKVYQGGTWIGMYQYIIRDGILVEKFDTGFGGYTYSATSNNTYVSQKNGYVEINGAKSGTGFTRTTNALNFTNAKSLVVEFLSATTWKHENAGMAVWNKKVTASRDARIAYANMKNSNLTGLTLNVSGITGVNYAGFETVGTDTPFHIVNMYLVMG